MKNNRLVYILLCLLNLSWANARNKQQEAEALIKSRLKPYTIIRSRPVTMLPRLLNYFLKKGKMIKKLKQCSITVRQKSY